MVGVWEFVVGIVCTCVLFASCPLAASACQGAFRTPILAAHRPCVDVAVLVVLALNLETKSHGTFTASATWRLRLHMKLYHAASHTIASPPPCPYMRLAADHGLATEYPTGRGTSKCVPLRMLVATRACVPSVAHHTVLAPKLLGARCRAKPWATPRLRRSRTSWSGWGPSSPSATRPHRRQQRSRRAAHAGVGGELYPHPFWFKSGWLSRESP